MASDRAVPVHAVFSPDTQPFAFLVPNLEPVEGVGSIRAKDCAQCHDEIYREWSASTHATAVRDIQFQSELTKSDSPKWLCMNCHAPIQNQRRRIMTGLQGGDVLKPISRPNPQFDSIFQIESVSCASCHIRKDPKTGKSVIIGSIGSPHAPHPVRKDAPFLREVCYRCHDPKGEAITPNLLCWFETRKELAEGQADLRQRTGKKESCASCHMPQTLRKLTNLSLDLPTRKSHGHHWVGSGIPKWFAGYDSLLARGYRSALEVGMKWKKQRNSLLFTVTLSNLSAGHYLPTADPERFLQARLSLLAKDGKPLVDTLYRIGQTWEWGPAKKLGDNRLKQGERRDWEIVWRNNPKAQSVHLRIHHVRLNTTMAQYVRAAQGVDESLLPGGQELVNQLEHHYPLANLIHDERIDLRSGERKRLTVEELIEESSKEQGKPLEEREY